MDWTTVDPHAHLDLPEPPMGAAYARRFIRRSYVAWEAELFARSARQACLTFSATGALALARPGTATPPASISCMARLHAC